MRTSNRSRVAAAGSRSVEVLLCALALAGCSSGSGSSATDDAGAGDADTAPLQDVAPLGDAAEGGVFCDFKKHCAEGNVCDLAANVCRPVAPDCATAACDADHVCDDTADGVNTGIVCVTPKKAGETCRYSDDHNTCAAGLFCDEASGSVCKPQLAAGATCPTVGYFFCVDGYTCRGDVLGEPNVCTKEVRVGGACLNDSDCVVEAECPAGKCVKRPRRGEPCTGFTECLFGSVCTAGVCSGHF